MAVDAFKFEGHTANLSPQGDCDQKQFAECMPLTREGIAFSGKAHGFTDAAIGRYHLEDDVEGGEGQGMGLVIVRFGDSDEEDGEAKPPHVVIELGAKLLVHKSRAGKLREVWIALIGRVVEIISIGRC